MELDFTKLAVILLLVGAVDAQVFSDGAYNHTVNIVLGGATNATDGTYIHNTQIWIWGGELTDGTYNHTVDIFYQWSNISRTYSSISLASSLVGGYLVSDWSASTSMYGTYTITFNNTDYTLGYNNYAADFSIDTDYVPNETNRNLNFSAGEVKVFPIKGTARNIHVLSPPASPSLSTLPTSKHYSVPFTLNVTTDEVASYNIKISIPLSILTEWSSRSSEFGYVSGSTTGISLTTTSSTLDFYIVSRALTKGTHACQVDWYVTTAGGSGGGGGGGGAGPTYYTTSIPLLGITQIPLSFSIVSPDHIGPTTTQSALPGDSFYNIVDVRNDESVPLDFTVSFIAPANGTPSMALWCSLSNFVENATVNASQLSVRPKEFLEFRVDCRIPSNALNNTKYEATLKVVGCTNSSGTISCDTRMLPAYTTIGISSFSSVLMETKNKLLYPIGFCFNKEDCMGKDYCVGSDKPPPVVMGICFSCMRLWMYLIPITIILSIWGVNKYYKSKNNRFEFAIGLFGVLSSAYIIYSIL